MVGLPRAPRMAQPSGSSRPRPAIHRLRLALPRSGMPVNVPDGPKGSRSFGAPDMLGGRPIVPLSRCPAVPLSRCPAEPPGPRPSAGVVPADGGASRGARVLWAGMLLPQVMIRALCHRVGERRGRVDKTSPVLNTTCCRKWVAIVRGGGYRGRPSV
ncbi:hypothetical protein FAIPA1_40096 [Frankia sp. AiPs1]